MKKIDIIIPAYKAQDTIDRTLASISIQSIVDKVKVTIVNDCDGIGYSKFIKRYKGIIDIEEIVLKKNGGPGVARQIGLVKTKAPYVTFIDADDTFYHSFSIELMLKHLESDPKHVVSIGKFLEQQKPTGLTLLTHDKDEIWMFGKLYKRSFLNKYAIQFNTTRSNEDTGFNAIVKLCANDNERIIFFDDIVYIWWFKADSITRVNDFEYTYNQSFIGYTENMMYAIRHVRSVQPFNTSVDFKAIITMAELYIYWMKTKFRDERFIEQNFEWCKIYYNEIFKEIMSRIPQSHIIPIVANQLAKQSQGIRDIVLDVTFYQFLEMLDEEEKEETKESEVVEENEQ